MTTLICGSFAYDTIMVFPDKFQNHILPDQVHILNVSFQVPQMRREFGGCAGNIAYNLRLLGDDALPMGTVGEDFEPYAKWMDQCRIPRTHVKVIPGTYTAQAFITTDVQDNQITAFHPGAMLRAHELKVSQANGVRLGIVSPENREGMMEHAQQFAEGGIPFVFDPGQGIILFNGEELERFLDQATFLAVNDYEGRLIQDKTGKSLKQLAGRVDALIVTKGAAGSEIYAGGKVYEIPPVRAANVVDPTGCGDAYRAGLLFGIAQGMDWDATGRIASLMGAIKVASPGTQNHRFTVEDFRGRFKQAFGFEF